MAVSKKMKAGHNSAVLSKRQAQRMLTDRKESHPSDYNINPTDDMCTLRDARSRIADMRLAEELGIDLADWE
jgi:hypothetical protein